jgi:hypothetical protein
VAVAKACLAVAGLLAGALLVLIVAASPVFQKLKEGWTRQL